MTTPKQSKTDNALRAELEKTKTQLATAIEERDIANDQCFKLLRERRNKDATQRLDDLLLQHAERDLNNPILDPRGKPGEAIRLPHQEESRSTGSLVGAIFVLLLLIAAGSFAGYKIHKLDIADHKKTERIEQLERLDLGGRVEQLEITVEQLQQPAENPQ